MAACPGDLAGVNSCRVAAVLGCPFLPPGFASIPMPRIAALVLLLLLAACYQVEGQTVPVAASVRVDGARDGLYRRPDGVEIAIRWNAAQRQYDVAGEAGTPAGTARAALLAPGLYLVQYEDTARLSLLASRQGNDLVLFAPARSAEQRLLKAHGLELRPGPIDTLAGSSVAVMAFFKDLAASGDYAEAGRLTFLR